MPDAVGLSGGMPREVWLMVCDAAILLLALLTGWRVGILVTRRLVEHGFESLFRVPWATARKTPGGPESGRRKHLRMSRVAGLWTQWSNWLVAAWVLAWQRGLPQIAETLGLLLGQAWLIAGTAVGCLALSRLLVSALLRCIQHETIRIRLDEYFPTTNPDGERFSDSAARVVGIGLYIMVFALVFVVLADLMGWTTTSALASGLWSTIIQLGGVGIALLMAWGIWRWTEADEVNRGTRRAELLAFFGTTILSAWILTSTLTFLLTLVVLAVLLYVLWVNREHLPDLWAGVYLRLNKGKSMLLNGDLVQIVKISLLSTRIELQGRESQWRNRDLFTALQRAKPTNGHATIPAENEAQEDVQSKS